MPLQDWRDWLSKVLRQPSKQPQLAPAALIQAQAEGRVIVTEYPYAPKPRRYGASKAGKRLRAWLDRADGGVGAWLAAAEPFGEALQRIPVHADPNGAEPGWVNGMLPGLDSLLLYSIVRLRKPKTYLEIGSGNSTKFVRRAIQDGGLSTRIVSIDPHPRAEVDALCDLVIRRAAEDVSQADIARHLGPGDVLFIDNSHRSFPNSDVTVFFTELLPELPAGVAYGIHDIWLPGDYPVDWMDRFYNEQYLLTAYLLGGAGGDRLLFPAYHVWQGGRFKAQIARLLGAAHFKGVARHGATFWMERGAGGLASP